MTHVLRKSYGPWSAGTQVEIIEPGVVSVVNGEPDEDFFDIEDGMVVKLRNRTDSVPIQNRRARRRVLAKLKV